MEDDFVTFNQQTFGTVTRQSEITAVLQKLR
jgi:hypothetical protein